MTLFSRSGSRRYRSLAAPTTSATSTRPEFAGAEVCVGSAAGAGVDDAADAGAGLEPDKIETASALFFSDGGAGVKSGSMRSLSAVRTSTKLDPSGVSKILVVSPSGARLTSRLV